MSQNHTKTLVNNIKGVCDDSNPNLSFARDSHVQQVAPDVGTGLNLSETGEVASNDCVRSGLSLTIRGHYFQTGRPAKRDADKDGWDTVTAV
ncbi:hypothetical protein PoB_004961800 [Plakobranchus ocellatus]|uniref:Uncharacterized protein n=1 Tax=Plakobranchus ocellatus TaxID=259542 RepID=A0AAV4BWC4_9GAST|nr:hypothetical protein PoB_004961800 [Plakobranchus ocellatus]